LSHRFPKYLLATLVALVSSAWALPSSPAPLRTSQGSLAWDGAIPVLRLTGSPYEMGAQQGTLLRQPLRESVQTYLYDGFLRAAPSAHFDLLAWARGLDVSLPEGVRREMAGIAHGAGLSYSDVLLLNVVPDYVCLAETLPGAYTSAPFVDMLDGCGLGSAAFAAWGRSTYGGNLILGYSTAIGQENVNGPRWVLVVRQPTHGNASVSVGTIGSVGVWLGVTEDGLLAALLPSASVDVATNGQTLPLLLRQALEGSDDLDGVTNTILGSARICGGNLIVADSTAPEALTIELSAHRHALLSASKTGEFVACANHFLDRELAATQPTVQRNDGRAESESRLRSLQTALELNLGWIGVEKALRIMGELAGGSGSMALGLNNRTKTSCLLQGILWSHDQLTLLLSQGCSPTDPDGRTRLDLRTLFSSDR
jgi:hypothetical protein